jgi:hypothetical protein
LNTHWDKAGTDVKKLAVAIGLMVAIAGCQSMPQGPTTVFDDNESFMSLWGRYSRCQAGIDLAEMQIEAHHLQQVAASATSKKGFTLTLPKQVQRYVAEPPTRLAVDPKAMAAACTLYTGQFAAEIGKADVATTMFQSILKNQPQPEYEYYAAQAQAGLSQLELALKSEGQARVLRMSMQSSSKRSAANNSTVN